MVTAVGGGVGTVVHVNVGLGKHGPWAKPDKQTVWTRPGDADRVRFQGPDEFTIEFETAMPFPNKKYVAQPVDGLYVVDEQILLDAPEDDYKYTLTTDGQTLDPDIVVRKDPRYP
jgi:hypothetical protein